MDPLDYWRLCDELSVVQAALLIVGEDPSTYRRVIDKQEPHNRPTGYEAAKAALKNAIRGKRLPGEIFIYQDEDGEQEDLHRTNIMVADLQVWLRSRGIKTGFFFPAPEAEPDYLSKSHPNYSGKLAAAIEAWKAVSADDQLRSGKSVKQTLLIWLRQHANEFGLTKDDGSPNDQGIEEVAKIANWDTRGGAPKTPANPPTPFTSLNDNDFFASRAGLNSRCSPKPSQSLSNFQGEFSSTS